MALFKLAAVGAAGYALWKYVQREQNRGDRAELNTYPRYGVPVSQSDAGGNNMQSTRSDQRKSGEPSFPATGLPGNPV